MRVLFAPDSFKGSLSSVEVARALAAGWRRTRPDDELILTPLADGGEGTLDAIEAAGGWRRRMARAHDPIGRPIQAAWLRSPDGTRAVVELAAASGLSRLAADELDPTGATTYGTGETLLGAIGAGARDIVLGIGGSATTDGGAGLLRALAGQAADEGPEFARLDSRLREVDLRIACDVTNPLLGPAGAAAVYGPQKGASPEQVAWLDRRLQAWSEVVATVTGTNEAATPGAGAAGGVGFGLLSVRAWFRHLELVPGVEVVMAAAGFDAKLARADLVITGEGRIDAQTAHGKTAFGVARRAREAGIPCVAVGGGVEPEGAEVLDALGVEVVAVHVRKIDVGEAIAAGAAPIEACGERLARMATDNPGPARIRP